MTLTPTPSTDRSVDFLNLMQIWQVDKSSLVFPTKNWLAWCWSFLISSFVCVREGGVSGASFFDPWKRTPCRWIHDASIDIQLENLIFFRKRLHWNRAKQRECIPRSLSSWGTQTQTCVWEFMTVPPVGLSNEKKRYYIKSCSQLVFTDKVSALAEHQFLHQTRESWCWFSTIFMTATECFTAGKRNDLRLFLQVKSTPPAFAFCIFPSVLNKGRKRNVIPVGAEHPTWASFFTMHQQSSLTALWWPQSWVPFHPLQWVFQTCWGLLFLSLRLCMRVLSFNVYHTPPCTYEAILDGGVFIAGAWFWRGVEVRAPCGYLQIQTPKQHNHRLQLHHWSLPEGPSRQENKFDNYATRANSRKFLSGAEEAE